LRSASRAGCPAEAEATADLILLEVLAAAT